MIENDRQLEITRELADSYRQGREELIQQRIEHGSDAILEATIGSIEGQLLRLYDEIKEYEARVGAT